MQKLLVKLSKIVAFAGFKLTDKVNREDIKKRAKLLQKSALVKNNSIYFVVKGRKVIKCGLYDVDGQKFYLNDDFVNKFFSENPFPLILKVFVNGYVKKYRFVNVELH